MTFVAGDLSLRRQVGAVKAATRRRRPDAADSLIRPPITCQPKSDDAQVLAPRRPGAGREVDAAPAFTAEVPIGEAAALAIERAALGEASPQRRRRLARFAPSRQPSLRHEAREVPLVARARPRGRHQARLHQYVRDARDDPGRQQDDQDACNDLHASASWRRPPPRGSSGWMT